MPTQRTKNNHAYNIVASCVVIRTLLETKSKVFGARIEEMSQSNSAEDVEGYNLLAEVTNVGNMLFTTQLVHSTGSKV